MPPTSSLRHIAQFNIRLSGRQASRDLLDNLLDCTVENSIHLPDMCTIRLYDAEFRWLDSEALREGTRVEIFGGDEEDAQLQPLFDGEVVALEMDLAGHGVPTIIARCYDRSHRLHRGRCSRAFVQVKDSDIVEKIGSEMSFTVHADSTVGVHDWVLQNNQSNWEFLTERAARNGFRLYVKKQKELHFHAVKDSGDGVIALEWGETLRSFRPRTSLASQVDEVMVRGWDPHTKHVILGHSKKPRGVPTIGAGATGSEMAHRAFGAARMIVTDRPVHTQQEAEEMAQSLYDDIAGTFLEAEGLCQGMPLLKPGMMVEVKNIGKRFSGKYYATATTHVYTPSEGYTTLFSVTGKRPSTLLAMLNEEGGGHRAALGGNIVVGVVTDNNDPKGMGRVKIMYPWLTEEHTSFWARTASQMAGKGRGMFNLPEIDDEVLVAFEQGEISRPYVLGQLWNGKDALPGVSGNKVLGPGNEVNRRGFHTRIGHQLNFDDTGGKGDITLKTAGNHKVAIDDAGKKVEITTTGGHKFVLDDGGKKISATTTAGHKMVLDDAGAMITISDPGGDMVTIQDSGIINVSAKQTINLSAQSINITAAQNLNMTGGQMTNVSSGVYLGLQATVVTNITGAAIKVNGGIIRVDGKMVDINSL